MSALHLTQRAAAEIETFLKGEGLSPDTPLRVAIDGGGCCSLDFNLILEPEGQKRDDELIEAAGFSFLIDSISARHLGETELDFVEDLIGSRFVFRSLEVANNGSV